MHDRPLRRGGFESATRLGGRKFHDSAAPDVHVQRLVFHVDPRPDDLAGPRDAVQRRAAIREIHRGLAETLRAFPAADEMRGRRGPADEKDPHVFAAELRAPAHIVQRVFDRLAERAMHAIREQPVQPGALVHFVEMDHGLAFEEHPPSVARAHGRTIGVVQRAFHEVARGQQVFQSLLILDADGVAAEVIRDPHGGDIHFALEPDLRVGQVALVARAGVKFHSAFFQPRAHRIRLGVRHAHRLGVERGLAEAFLENAARVQRVIGDDRVEHAHAALVEHPHDRLLPHELRRELLAEFPRPRGHLHFGQRTNVRGVVRDAPGLEPLPEFRAENVVRELLAPQRRVAHARLRQRAVEIQHPDQPRPLPAPIRHRENRPAMGRQPREQMMRILPHRLGHDQRRIRRDVAKHLDPHPLPIDETVLLHLVERMRPPHGPALGLQGKRQNFLHRGLRGPADLICGESEVATGDEICGFHRWEKGSAKRRKSAQTPARMEEFSSLQSETQ